MKILKDTLELLIEEWDDPGDYPNAVAQSPLPSYSYVEGMEGELKIELTDQELKEMHECFECESVDFWMNEVVDYSPKGVVSVKWQVDTIKGNVVTLSVIEVEAESFDKEDWQSFYEDYS